FEKCLKRFEDSIDRYTDYIENGQQRQAAQENNRTKEKIIAYIKKYEHLPARITVNHFREFYIEQAFHMIDGLEKRNERDIVLQMIGWMKRMGFLKNKDLPESLKTKEENVVRYTKIVDAYDLSFQYEMCFEIRKDDEGRYSIRFFYDFYDFNAKHVENNKPSLYTPVFMRKGSYV